MVKRVLEIIVVFWIAVAVIVFVVMLLRIVTSPHFATDMAS